MKDLITTIKLHGVNNNNRENVSNNDYMMPPLHCHII